MPRCCNKCEDAIGVEDKNVTCDCCRVAFHLAEGCSGLSSSEQRKVVLQKRLLMYLCAKCRNAFKSAPMVIEKIEKLQDEVIKLKKEIEVLKTSPSSNTEQIISEAHERHIRSRNLMVFDVPELANSGLQEKIRHDTSIVHNIFQRLGYENEVEAIEKMSSCAIPAAPAPPALKDLPKVAGDLKSELEGFSSTKLKNAETQEKIVLPSAEDVAQEKTHNALIAGVENFNSSLLKRTDTKEKIVLPNAQDVAAEKSEKALIEGIAKFDATKLKHTETQEKNPLPDKDVIEQEKAQTNLLSGIENFDSSKLKHAETQEKNPLPTKEIIDQEKSA
ncbi:unnamed protein product [Ceutorhynchus assimilis]|uniref:Uncharacterized protein n=1 Tax=Ceutorhynchus assimilis TaxID=467358 RepID=A0A9N9MXV1_9CUCU|nr:unnamed protein product [Ceutorhynchus assimilis]